MDKDEKKELQIEALKQLIDYSKDLIPGVEGLISELRLGRQEDTDELLNLVIMGINWEIEIFNNTENLINVDRKRIDKSFMTAAVTRLGQVLQAGDDCQIADCLESGFMPFLQNLEIAAATIVSQSYAYPL